MKVTIELDTQQGDDAALLDKIHLTPEAAALHGKALASLTAGEEVEP